MNIHDTKVVVCSKCKKAIGEVNFDAQIQSSICGFCTSILNHGDGICFPAIYPNISLRDSSRGT